MGVLGTRNAAVSVRRARRGRLVALAAVAVGCSSTDHTASTAQSGSPPASTTATSATTEPSSTTSAPGGSLHVALAWPVLFAVPGTILPLSLVIDGLDPSGQVTLQARAPDAAPTEATFDETWSTWDAELPVPEQLDATTLTIDVRVGAQDVPTAVSSVNVPVADVTGVLQPTFVDAVAEPVVLLPWGVGHGEVAFSAGEEVATIVPAAFAIDDRTGDAIVLDTVNHRLVVVTHDGTTTEIPIPGTAALTDLILTDEPGTVVVIGWEIGDPPRTSASIVDVGTTKVTSIGPVLLPTQAPTNTWFVLNPVDNIVYGRIDNRYYPYLDLTRRALIPSLDTRTWLESTANGSNLLTLGSGGSVVSIKFPPALGGLGDVQRSDDANIWFIETVIDADASSQPAISSYLARVDPTTGTVTAVPIPEPGSDEFTRRLDASDGTAYIMRATVDGLLIEHYILP